jgi:hypothetical protein
MVARRFSVNLLEKLGDAFFCLASLVVVAENLGNGRLGISAASLCE